MLETMGRYQLRCVIFLALATISIAALAAELEGLAARSKWFDFEAYKVAYGKSYSSLTEELVRRKCFLARAFRAFVSSSKYKLDLSPYYLAVNHMSDWTPRELNQKLYGSAANGTIEDQILSAEARRVAVEAGGEPEVGANATLSRRKRQPEVPWEQPDPVRWDKLEIVLQSWEAHVGPFDPMGRLMGIGANENLSRQMLAYKPPRKLPNGDIVFVDHRDSGCLTGVRHQGDCGCCYASSALSQFEWAYCMKFGRQIEFSEQYLVDCGRPFGLNGCQGGVIDKVTHFVNNVGLELLEDYPFRSREEKCPYDNQLHPNVVRGSHRMQIRIGLAFGRKMFPVMVAQSPIVARIKFVPDSIYEYGGGVLTDGSYKKESSSHQMLLVGHGVESGLEYWLMRNSWGPDWGEAGYIKVEKEVIASCSENIGVVLVANLEGAIVVDIQENYLNKRQVVGLLMSRDKESGRWGNGEDEMDVGRYVERKRGRVKDRERGSERGWRSRGFWGCFK